MCRDDSLTAAIQKMDASVINREDLEKLVGFITRKKYKGLMKKVKEFAESFPEHPFDEAESFMLLLSRTEGIINSLNLWKIKLDCEAVENEICEPLMALVKCVKLIKDSKELVLVLGVTLKVINFMKSSDFKAVRIEDLYKLEVVKDNAKSDSLLFHIVRKVVQVQPEFAGFPADLMEGLAAMEVIDLKALDTEVELVEKGYRWEEATTSIPRDPLIFLIKQHRAEPEGENYYSTLRQFMNDQVEIV